MQCPQCSKQTDATNNKPIFLVFYCVSKHLGFFMQNLSEAIKYYFADFVRKGGTPPPLRTKFSAKKELRNWGVPPSPPLRIFPRKFSFKKGKKLCFLLKKHLFLVKNIGYGFGGYPPPPLYGKKFQQKGGYGLGGTTAPP